LAGLRIGDEEGQQRREQREEAPGPPPAREQQQHAEHEQPGQDVRRVDDEPEDLARDRRHERHSPEACRG
jgi:hypothetical protein